jgi:type IV pilus assembly protein PilW
MKRGATGLSMVELLVALAIGSFLIAGAVYVYAQTRTTHTTSDAVARLQENARFVLSVIEPDVQLAGYYGFSNASQDIKYIADGSTADAVPAVRLGTDASSPDVLTMCGKNFAVNVTATIEGTNNSYFRPTTDTACAAAAGGAQPNTDTLTVRRSSGPPDDGVGTLVDHRMQLLVSRLSPTNQLLFSDGTLPPATTTQVNYVQVRDMVVRTYYVAQNSLNPDVTGLPSLRVKFLSSDGTAPNFDDEEVMRGVEDLQVQFGIDTGDYDGDGVIDAGRDEDGNGIPDAPNGVATRYVNPGAVPAGFQVVAVRLWVMVRTEKPEIGFVNDHNYQYAGKSFTPNDGFRRVLMSRTIQLRNSRTL